MDRQDLEILRRVPLFAGLDEPQLGALLRDVSVQDHPKGQLLFQQGDTADCFYVVLGGWVKIFRLTSEGDDTNTRNVSTTCSLRRSFSRQAPILAFNKTGL